MHVFIAECVSAYCPKFFMYINICNCTHFILRSFIGSQEDRKRLRGEIIHKMVDFNVIITT